MGLTLGLTFMVLSFAVDADDARGSAGDDELLVAVDDAAA
jgi:hypothetical protein